MIDAQRLETIVQPVPMAEERAAAEIICSVYALDMITFGIIRASNTGTRERMGR